MKKVVLRFVLICLIGINIQAKAVKIDSVAVEHEVAVEMIIANFFSALDQYRQDHDLDILTRDEQIERLTLPYLSDFVRSGRINDSSDHERTELINQWLVSKDLLATQMHALYIIDQPLAMDADDNLLVSETAYRLLFSFLNHPGELAVIESYYRPGSLFGACALIIDHHLAFIANIVEIN